MSLVHTRREGLDGVVKPDNGDHDKKNEEKKGNEGTGRGKGKKGEKKAMKSKNAEGMDDMEGMDHEDGEEEEEDLEDGEGMDDMEGMDDQGDTVQAPAKKIQRIASIGSMNAKQMSKITEQLMGYKDMLTGKERIERVDIIAVLKA